jgi:hypothetical protein
MGAMPSRSTHWSDQTYRRGDTVGPWAAGAAPVCRTAPFLWLIAEGVIVAPWRPTSRRATEPWQLDAQRQVLELISRPVAWVSVADSVVRPVPLPSDPAWIARRMHDGALIKTGR